MLLVTVVSGEDLGETVFLWMNWAHCLCLCRMETMEPLDWTMSPWTGPWAPSRNRHGVIAVAHRVTLWFCCNTLRGSSHDLLSSCCLCYSFCQSREKEPKYLALQSWSSGRRWRCPGTGSFYLKPRPPGVPRTDRHHLEDTQEAGGSSGHIPAHSVNIENKFACRIIEGMFQPGSGHCLRNSFRKNNQEVGYSRVFQNQICGPKLVACQIKEKIMIRNREIPQNFQLLFVMKRSFPTPNPWSSFCKIPGSEILLLSQIPVWEPEAWGARVTSAKIHSPLTVAPTWKHLFRIFAFNKFPRAEFVTLEELFT